MSNARKQLIQTGPRPPLTVLFHNSPDFVNSYNQQASLGIELKRVLHGEEAYEYLAPIAPGDTLTGVMTLVDGKSRQGKDGSSMDILTIEVRYTNQHDQAVLNAREVIVVRG